MWVKVKVTKQHCRMWLISRAAFTANHFFSASKMCEIHTSMRPFPWQPSLEWFELLWVCLALVCQGFFPKRMAALLQLQLLQCNVLHHSWEHPLYSSSLSLYQSLYTVIRSQRFYLWHPVKSPSMAKMVPSSQAGAWNPSPRSVSKERWTAILKSRCRGSWVVKGNNSYIIEPIITIDC